MIKFTQPSYAKPIRYEAASFIVRLCENSSTMSQLITCGGIEALVNLLAFDYFENRNLVTESARACSCCSSR